MNGVISADIRQSIFYTLYLLFSHNYEAVAYFTGMVIGIVLLIKKPSRFATFIMLGFAILLFQYEYDKHIIVGLREQTLTSLATTATHLRFTRLISTIISDILPIIFYLLGWGMVFVSIIYASFKIQTKDHPHEKSKNK
jgi:hypothetical protein